MHKIVLNLLLIFLAHAMEFFFYNLFGRSFMPNMILLLVIYLNLFLGIRYSLMAAIVGGVLKDSFSASFFGVNLFSFIVCAYLVTIVKKYIYVKGSNLSRIFLVCVFCVFNVVIQYFLFLIFHKTSFVETLKYVLWPQLIATLILAPPTFYYLRQCALKYFV